MNGEVKTCVAEKNTVCSQPYAAGVTGDRCLSMTPSMVVKALCGEAILYRNRFDCSLKVPDFACPGHTPLLITMKFGITVLSKMAERCIFKDFYFLSVSKWQLFVGIFRSFGQRLERLS